MNKNENSTQKNTRRVILNIPIDLDDKIKVLSLQRGLPKSNMILFAISWYLDYNKSLDLMPKMFEALKNIPENTDSENDTDKLK